jgi:hypothetical protein
MMELLSFLKRVNMELKLDYVFIHLYKGIIAPVKIILKILFHIKTKAK